MCVAFQHAVNNGVFLYDEKQSEPGVKFLVCVHKLKNKDNSGSTIAAVFYYTPNKTQSGPSSRVYNIFKRKRSGQRVPHARRRRIQ